MKKIYRIIFIFIVMVLPMVVNAQSFENTVPSHKVTQKEVDTVRKTLHTRKNTNDLSDKQQIDSVSNDLLAESDKSTKATLESF